MTIKSVLHVTLDMPARQRHWINKAMSKRRGMLRNIASKDGGMTSAGTIRMSWLKARAQGNSEVAKRARCAITLKTMQAKRRGK